MALTNPDIADRSNDDHYLSSIGKQSLLVGPLKLRKADGTQYSILSNADISTLITLLGEIGLFEVTGGGS